MIQKIFEAFSKRDGTKFYKICQIWQQQQKIGVGIGVVLCIL